MAPHSSTPAWRVLWTEEPGGLQSMGSLRVRHNWATSLSLFTFMHWRRKWQPTPVFLPGESQGQGSLVGCWLKWLSSSSNGNPLQNSCLENPVDRGSWRVGYSTWGHKELDTTDWLTLKNVHHTMGNWRWAWRGYWAPNICSLQMWRVTFFYQSPHFIVIVCCRGSDHR